MPSPASDILERPLLIVGAPRSGTTWLMRTLLQDRRLVGGQESHFFRLLGSSLQAFDRQLARPRQTGLGCYWRREELVVELRRLWRKTFEPLVVARPDAQLLVEKTPDHALWLDVAKDIIPEARVIHIVRDSRAVVASLLEASRRPWGRVWAPKSRQAAVTIWRSHVSAALNSPLPVHLVRYEDLVDDAPTVLAGIYAFLDLPQDPASSATAAASGTSLDAYVASGDVGDLRPEPEGFGRSGEEARDAWKTSLGAWDRWRVWADTRDVLEPLGYGPRGARPRR
ncbi:MAG: sulfotransferase [Planctomycetaceae bacterium]|jgi:hypothetical protein|nr:sulfotransferase [Planctomycetaceae bacterium]